MKITLDLTDSEIKNLRSAKLNVSLKLKIAYAILDVPEETLKIKVIDLRNCKPGDILISKHGKKFIYVSYDETSSYPHNITDFKTRKERCSRTDSGHVFHQNRQEGDHDIVQIIHNTP